MVASDFGAGGFGEMGKLGWSDLWDGGQGRGSGLRASPGGAGRDLWFRADLILVVKTGE